MAERVEVTRRRLLAVGGAGAGTMVGGLAENSIKATAIGAAVLVGSIVFQHIKFLRADVNISTNVQTTKS